MIFFSEDAYHGGRGTVFGIDLFQRLVRAREQSRLDEGPQVGHFVRSLLGRRDAAGALLFGSAVDTRRPRGHFCATDS